LFRQEVTVQSTLVSGTLTNTLAPSGTFIYRSTVAAN